MLLWSLIFLIPTLSNLVYGAKILGVFYMPSYSHFILGERILKELAARGHEVTMISAYPQKTPIKNYRDIDLPEIREFSANMKKDTKFLDFEKQSPLQSVAQVSIMGTMLTEKTLGSKSVQMLLKSDESFDLVMMEQFLNDAHQGFAHHFKAPLIVVSTVGSSSWTNRLAGNLALPSYAPDPLTRFSPSMNFFERTLNTLFAIYQTIYLELVHFPAQNIILHRYFPGAPHIYDLIYSTSLVLLNSHPSCSSPLPHLPNMIEIGGFHVDTSTKLPEDLQKFLDDAKEGVVYFSMGSNLRSKEIPDDTRNGILKSFGKLKMKVLLKWEDDELPSRPQNVRIEKWLPQSAVLAHPNVLIFITHGGRMSTIETIHHGVPVIGIPFFGDQKKNMAEIVHLGCGISIQYSDLTEQSLDAALTEIIRNPKYAENVKSRSQFLRSLPVKPIDNAMYWIEYVLAHKGAPHLRPPSIDLHWYQYFLLDVIAFLAAIITVVFVIFYIIMKKLLRRRYKPKQKKN